MKLFRLLLAALFAASPVSAAQKTAPVELPRLSPQAALVQQVSLSALQAPTLALQTPVLSLPKVEGPTATASLQAVSNAVLQPQGPQAQAPTPESQGAALSRTFDGHYAAATETPPQGVRTGFAPRQPNQYALIPAAARLLQRHHIKKPAVDRLLTKALRGMLEKAGATKYKQAMPYYRQLQAAFVQQEIGHGFGWTKNLIGDPYINAVAPDSAAEKAGLRPGDVIELVDGQSLEMASGSKLAQALDPQRTIHITVARHTENGWVKFERVLQPQVYEVNEFHKKLPAITKVFQTVAETFAPTAGAKLIDAAMTKMGQSLDRYTEYFNAEDADEFRKHFEEQTYGGFGLQMEGKVGGSKVRAVMPGSPAARAGLAEGDMVLSVDDKSLAGLTADEVSDILRRRVGEPATVIFMKADGRRFRAIMNAAELVLPNAGGGMLDGDTGYVTLVNFSEGTLASTYEIVHNLRKAGAKKLVIDLRYNPGGQLDAATQLASLFLHAGRSITKLVYAYKGPTHAATMAAGEFADMKVAILIGRESASASEMFTAALQDNGRAVVVGEPSFGKGVGQETHGLTEGRAFKMTTFKWLTPRGRNITEGDGLKPDIRLTYNEAERPEMFRRVASALFSGRTPGLGDAAVYAAWKSLMGARAPVAP